MEAFVTLASSNEQSLMVMFDGMFMGYVGMMPLLKEKSGPYRDLVKGREVKVTKTERAGGVK